ncbi:MAG: 1-deoxy-D-xylulose-5-phosphate synthase [Clostridia bacterium]
MYEVLNHIETPRDIKELKYPELFKLAEEIRYFILKNVSRTGGHLASNLGIVELTLALHYVFDSPTDKIIWDVGHQSYVHKIVTGRKDDFATLRTWGGLSGFPKRGESAHDVFETGHSSTSISAALGMARGRDLKGDHYEVVAVIGDGALSGGMAFEALNDAGHVGNKLIVVLNDNEMSISRNVGAMSSYLSRIRTNPKYTKVKREVESLINRIPFIGRGIAHAIEKVKNSLKYLVISGIFFEEIGFTYLGPIDGHNLLALVEVFRQAQKLPGPVFVHVVTQKGKGYPYAEKNPEKFHGISPFHIETGEPASKQRVSFSQAFGDKLAEMATKDNRIVAITAAMPEGTGLMGFREKFPERFFDVGIAEQHAVTMAAGLAASGMKPFFAVYSTFLQRAYDQVLHDVCIQKLPVVLAIDRAGLVGEDGETHQGVFDISFLRHMPHMTIMAPKDVNELYRMMELSLSIDGPVAIRYPKEGALISTNTHETSLEYGKWEMIASQGVGVIIATGRMVDIAIKTADLLKRDGIILGVVNARFIKPIDEKMLLRISKKYGLLITLEDNVLIGGLGSAVTEFLSQHLLMEKQPDIMNLGIPDQFVPHGKVDILFDEMGLSPSRLATRIKGRLEQYQRKNSKSYRTATR